MKQQSEFNWKRVGIMMVVSLALMASYKAWDSYRRADASMIAFDEAIAGVQGFFLSCVSGRDSFSLNKLTLLEKGARRVATPSLPNFELFYLSGNEGSVSFEKTSGGETCNVLISANGDAVTPIVERLLPGLEIPITPIEMGDQPNSTSRLLRVWTLDRDPKFFITMQDRTKEAGQNTVLLTVSPA